MTILSLGFVLLAGLLAGKLIRQVKVPVVTAYLVLGIIIGPAMLNLVSEGRQAGYLDVCFCGYCTLVFDFCALFSSI
jgi:NhaP-type Na+/H+ or K+/H+ antiporter